MNNLKIIDTVLIFPFGAVQSVALTPKLCAAKIAWTIIGMDHVNLGHCMEHATHFPLVLIVVDRLQSMSAFVDYFRGFQRFPVHVFVVGDIGDPPAWTSQFNVTHVEDLSSYDIVAFVEAADRLEVSKAKIESSSSNAAEEPRVGLLSVPEMSANVESGVLTQLDSPSLEMLVQCEKSIIAVLKQVENPNYLSKTCKEYAEVLSLLRANYDYMYKLRYAKK